MIFLENYIFNNTMLNLKKNRGEQEEVKSRTPSVYVHDILNK